MQKTPKMVGSSLLHIIKSGWKNTDFFHHTRVLVEWELSTN